MRVSAVIAEYNPFHNGHAYQLEAMRKESDCDFAIAIMSGNFVQRGEPAIADKLTRAAWALDNGADMVIELPVYYSLANAQLFARGAVSILAASGIVDCLGFGCESEYISTIYSALKYRADNSQEFSKHLRLHLNTGKSYPRAAFEALSDMNAPSPVINAHLHPNSILAMEYIRAIETIAPDIKPVLTERRYGGHDSNGVVHDECGRAYTSASFIRQHFSEAHLIDKTLPQNVLSDLTPIDADKLSLLVMYALRSMSLEDLKLLPDIGEGFYNLVFKAAHTFTSMEDTLMFLKSKRYTLARIKRMLMCALLRIDSSFMYMKPAYIRVLGIRNDRRFLLSELCTKSTLPIISSARDIKKLSSDALKLFERDTFASDVYAQLTGNVPGSDYVRPLLRK